MKFILGIVLGIVAIFAFNDPAATDTQAWGFLILANIWLASTLR